MTAPVHQPPPQPSAPLSPAGHWARAGRWWQRLINTAAAVWLLWQVAPLLVLGERRPFDAPLARAGLLIGLGLALYGVHAGRQWQARRRNDHLLQGLQDSTHATDTLLRERFAQAMQVLRRGVDPAQAGRPRRPWQRRRHVYQLPWYLFIGAPGAGKTTALLNAGLNFPLAAATGRAPLAGIGGTRHCDWWFTEQAVFIDTAGRYTTQDSDPHADATEWRSFLGLLRRHRPAQPINGVIVTVSVPDLLEGREALRQQAHAVAQRLQELRDQLQQRFPVYLLITKTDLLAGFSEYFARCDAAEREQVWGIGYRLDMAGLADAHDPDPAFDPAETAARLQALAARLYHLAPTRLQQEPQPQRRAAIYHFAAQLETLAAPLQEFVGLGLAGCAQAPEQPVRGIFLSSGTQEGNPIDRVLGALTRGFGLMQRALPRPDGAGKAYFLARLLREGVIGEAALAGTNLRRQRLRRRLEHTSAATLALLLLLACALWGWSSHNNRLYLQGVRQQVEQLGRHLRADGDGARVDQLLPLYGILRDLAASGGIDPGQAPPGLGWGLFQGPRLAQSAAQTYHRVLDLSLAPLLAQRLSAVLADTGAAPAARYEALRVHQMLMQPQHLRRDEVRAWADRAFALGPAGHGVSAGERQQWLQHLDALLERNAVLESVQVDAAALRSARAALSRQPLAQRAYDRLLSAAADRLQDGAIEPHSGTAVTLAQLVGADAALLFSAREPGQPLPAIAPVYSADGWQRAVRPLLPATLARTVEEQAWVLGSGGSGEDGNASEPGRIEPGTLAREVLRLYAQDYSAHWERLLTRLALEPLAEGRDGAAAMTRLAAADSPLRRLLERLRRELQPGSDAGPAVAADAGLPLDTTLDDLLKGRHAPLLDQLQSSSPTGATRLLDALSTGRPGETATRLRAAADGAALPLATFWRQLAQGQERAQVQRVRAELGEALGELGRQCQAITHERYPFANTGRSEVSLADFSRLLGPQGLFDRFFREHLAPLVDTRRHPWRWTGATPSAGQVRALQTFEQAQQLRELFFASGSPAPLLRLKLVPVELDAALFWFSLDVDGQLLRYENGPRRTTSLVWPGAGSTGQVLLRIPRPDSADTATEIHEGRWALLRVLTRRPWNRAATGVAQVKIGHEGLGLGLLFELSTDPPADPWGLGQLGQFRCPSPW